MDYPRCVFTASREPAEIHTMTLVPKRHLAINMQEHAVWRALKNMKHVYKISSEDQSMTLHPKDEYTSKLYKQQPLKPKYCRSESLNRR